MDTGIRGNSDAADRHWQNVPLWQRCHVGRDVRHVPVVVLRTNSGVVGIGPPNKLPQVFGYCNWLSHTTRTNLVSNAVNERMNELALVCCAHERPYHMLSPRQVIAIHICKRLALPLK